MWNEVLFAIVAAVLYAEVSVVLKVIGTQLRSTGGPNVEGLSRTDHAEPQDPKAARAIVRSASMRASPFAASWVPIRSHMPSSARSELSGDNVVTA